MFGHLYRRAIAAYAATGDQLPLAKPLLRSLVHSGHLQLGGRVFLVGQDAQAFATFFEWLGMRCACCLDPALAIDAAADADTELWIIHADDLAPENWSKLFAALAPASRGRGLVILDAPQPRCEQFLQHLHVEQADRVNQTNGDAFVIHQYPGWLRRMLGSWSHSGKYDARISAIVLAPIAPSAAVPETSPTRKAA